MIKDYLPEKAELLAPAGDLEKCKIAILYGADAVYVSGEQFGLRTASKNFTDEELSEATRFVHERGKRIYVTCNIIPHNADFVGLEDYLIRLDEIGVDALIVADPGVFSVVREVLPDMEIHISTQANNTNYHSANFWYRQGAKRIVTARELSLEEIAQMRAHIPQDMDIETFVHGAMCISYSGRCLMSNYMTGRDANKGNCAQSCRWKYHLVEETRPGEYYPIEEDERGTYFFNSKDLCMIESIPELIRAGVNSFKIEGRVKTSFYVATIVRAYRMALDAFHADPEGYVYDPSWMEEIKKVSYRDFTTGFFEEKPDETAQNYGSSSYIRTYDFAGRVLGYDAERGLTQVEIRNRIFLGDEIEVIGPHFNTLVTHVAALFNEEMEAMEVAPRPMELVWMDLGQPLEAEYILRKKSENPKAQNMLT